jgi:hypothetical protein
VSSLAPEGASGSEGLSKVKSEEAVTWACEGRHRRCGRVSSECTYGSLGAIARFRVLATANQRGALYSGTERVSFLDPVTCASLKCCFRTMPQVMVISSDGYFYSYSIDLENGGECSLMKQYR